jgi:histidine triad (HIT) family protein
MEECLICQKHRGELLVPGGPVYEDDLFYVRHSAIGEGENATYLGISLLSPSVIFLV